MEFIQYNSALAVTDTIRGTSTEKLYNELGLEAFKKEDGTGNYAASIEFIKVIHQITFLTLFPPSIDITQGTLITFLNSM